MDTVEDTVEDTVGTVEDTVGTVVGTVEDTVGTVEDTVGMAAVAYRLISAAFSLATATDTPIPTVIPVTDMAVAVMDTVGNTPHTLGLSTTRGPGLTIAAAIATRAGIATIIAAITNLASLHPQQS